MAMEVEIVVLSEAPKDLDAGVKVMVGLPTKNPWSLPFAHKKFFAENVEQYDLFIYSEDDIGITEQNIQSFLQITPALEGDEIAGFIRYEKDTLGNPYLSEAHATAHWKPQSVRRRGTYTIAEFSNEHSGFYIVTQPQLRRALASGEFLRAPYQGRYGLPETAATDIYTCCGFRRVICISALEDFLIRHMSDRYVGQLEVSLRMFQEQIQTLMSIGDGAHPVSALGVAEPKVLQRNFYKSFYEQPSEDILKMFPPNAKQILSIGCGWGAMEVRLKKQGAEVTAIPLDSVFGAAAARWGINVVYGTLAECLSHLQNRKFDGVVMTDLLHLLPNPEQVIEQCGRLVGPGGTLVIGGPNFDRLPILIKRVLGKGDYRKLRSYDQSGINVIGPTDITKRLKSAGFSITTVQWLRHLPLRWRSLEIRARLGRLAAGNWLLQARKGLSR